ncbi:hypothetical protein BH93_27490 (plasmid) [Rhodococcoides fascians A25f]|uniref:hypothetical protein n=1 Tax=Rhodococcoides fascians TaxID=1828 RepID=UPI000AAB63A4|nr:hypothetical protein [Rhodococcus fascians]QII09316.1 hypothetical protein BH93_27490 [Rhodococcus fascians A25f]
MNNNHTPGQPTFLETLGGKAIPLGHKEGLIDLTVTVNGTTTRLDPPVFSTTNKADIVSGRRDHAFTDGDGFMARALRHRRATENGPL